MAIYRTEQLVAAEINFRYFLEYLITNKIQESEYVPCKTS